MQYLNYSNSSSVRKTTSKVTPEEEITVIQFQEKIFNYADKYNFHLHFVDMMSEAVKLNDPNPWLTIARKSLILGKANYDEFIGGEFLNDLKRENELLRKQLNWYKRRFGNYDYDYDPDDDDAVKITSSEESDVNKVSKTSSDSSCSSSPHQSTPPKRQKPSKSKRQIQNSPVPKLESVTSPFAEKKKNVEQVPLIKLKIKLPEDPSTPSTLGKRKFDISTRDSRKSLPDNEEPVSNKRIPNRGIDTLQPPITLKFNLNVGVDKPMVKIPNENVATNDQKLTIEIKDNQPTKGEDNVQNSEKRQPTLENDQRSKVVKDDQSPKELKDKKPTKFDIFARKRKEKPKQDDNKQVSREKVVETTKGSEILKAPQEIKEAPFKLKINPSSAISEVTITNSKVATPTGNVLLPPIISIDSETKSDFLDQQPMEIDEELKKENAARGYTSEEIIDDIEGAMMSIHEENSVKPLKNDSSSNDSRAFDASKNGDNTKSSKIITALNHDPPSLSLLQLSEEIDESPKKISPVKANQMKVKAPSSGGKHLGMLFMQAIDELDQKKTPKEVSDTESGSSEEISNEIDEVKNGHTAMICDNETENKPLGLDDLGENGGDNSTAKDSVAERVEENKLLHTLALDDFEPDYEPDE